MRSQKQTRLFWSNTNIYITILLWMRCLGGADAGTIKELPKVDESLINDVLVAAEKAVTFFEKDYSEINLDGLYGIRIGQGKIIECLEDCESNDFNCPPELVSRLEAILQKLETITGYALRYVMLNDESYAHRFIHTIEAPYIVNYIPEWLGDNLGPIGNNINYTGDVADACFGKVMGTFVKPDGHLSPSCTVDQLCWDFMNTPETYHYFVTHQLLYFIYGEKSGCLPVLENWAKKFNGVSVRDIQRAYCGRIYNESKWLSKSGKVDIFNQDLFIEQTLLCGLIGFQDFTNEPWIHLVIGWQLAEGCWGSPKEIRPPYETGITLDEVFAAYKANQRKLMTEAAMMGDCLSHESGLAFGTLGVYLRGLIEHVYRQN